MGAEASRADTRRRSKSNISSDQRFGYQLVSDGVISKEELDRAVHHQESLMVHRPLGQILVEQKAITQKQLNYLLDLRKKRQRLGDVLLSGGVISKDQLTAALESQKQTGLRLGETLIQLGYATEETIRQALCTQLNIPYFDLDNVILDQTLIRLINKNYARKHLVVPIARIGDAVTIAIDDPTMTRVIEEVQSFSGVTVNVVTSTREMIERAFARLYTEESSDGLELGGRLELIVDDRSKTRGKIKYVEDEQEERADAIVRKLIGAALDHGASDVHLERLDNRIHLRFRIDGVLQQLHLGSIQELLNKHAMSVVSRIKVLGSLDIAERRRPQDGSFRARMEKDGIATSVDFRISIVPSYYGESVVLRILDKRNAPASIEHLGFSAAITERLQHLLQRPSGIVLITGPTGSGKTSTLYGALMTVYRPGIKIVTVEDPIEYVYEHFIQSEVKEKIGNTFAAYLRALLRHDPEVIMVGEIRDGETAELAFRAAQTGHLVLSTLHTNDAVSAITRLQDLKIDSGMITSSLLAVLAQRLVRRNCQDCKEEHTPSQELLREFFNTPFPDVRWYRGRGCNNCGAKGYKGRMPVAELWVPSDDDILLINKEAPFDQIRASARKNTITMAEDVGERLREGRTSLEELMRMLPYPSVYQFREVWPSQSVRSNPAAV